MPKTRLRSSSTSSAGCLALFGLPFAGVGVFMLWLIGSTLWRAREMADWPTTPATLLEAKLEENRSSDGSSQRAVARYTYSWEGRPYEGDRVAISRGSDNIGSFQKRKADTLKHALRNNRTVSAHINPEDPSESILYPEIRWEMIAFHSLFALVFGGVGFGLVIGGLLGRGKSKARNALEASHPEEPWKWTPEWESGVIPAGGKGAAWGLSAFALFWNLVSLPVLIAFPAEFFEKGNKAIAIGLIFPVVGLGLIAAAAYAWLRFKKYGSCTLVLQQTPGVIGGPLAGAVKVPARVEAPDGYTLELKSVNRVVTGSGKHRSTREHELWADSKRLKRDLAAGGGRETVIPVLFHIPFDCREVDKRNSRNQILWKLTVSAKTPGVDFKSDFEVPVFKTSDSDPDYAGDDRALSSYLAEPDDAAFLRDEHVRVETTPRGGTRLVFPMMRHKGMAFGMVLMTLVWCGITVGLYLYTDAPILFPAVFGFFGVFLVLGSLQTCLTRTVIELSPGSLEWRGGWLGMKGPVTLDPAGIADIQAHSSGTSGNTAYYTLKAPANGGKPFTLVSQLKGRAHADALRKYIQDRTGV